MKKIQGICFIITGATLLTAALSLVLYNFNQDRKSGNSANEILVEIKNELPVQDKNSSASVNGKNLFEEYEIDESLSNESIIEVNNNGYIGIISIPALNIELPVRDEFSYSELKKSPCRYMGSVESGDLIIAAHNYRSHFGSLNELSGGETIFFTDASGIQREYEVIQNEIINGHDVEAMMSVNSDSWDLTLFTCTLSGNSRVTVRASEKY